MRKNCPTNRTYNLNLDISHRLPGQDLPAQQKGNGHRRIEMSAQNWAKDGDQNDKNSACRDCIAKQGNSHIPCR